MQELIDRWMRAGGSLRNDRFIALYACYAPQNGGYGHVMTYVVEFRERDELCAVCGSEFLTSRPYLCKANHHAPHESYRVIRRCTSYDLDTVIAEATQLA